MIRTTRTMSLQYLLSGYIREVGPAVRNIWRLQDESKDSKEARIASFLLTIEVWTHRNLTFRLEGQASGRITDRSV